jgi:hypothetical protein
MDLATEDSEADYYTTEDSQEDGHKNVSGIPCLHNRGQSGGWTQECFRYSLPTPQRTVRRMDTRMFQVFLAYTTEDSKEDGHKNVSCIPCLHYTTEESQEDGHKNVSGIPCLHHRGQSEGRTQECFRYSLPTPQRTVRRTDTRMFHVSLAYTTEDSQEDGHKNVSGIPCCTGPPDYIGWRKRFLGIKSWAP